MIIYTLDNSSLIWPAADACCLSRRTLCCEPPFPNDGRAQWHGLGVRLTSVHVPGAQLFCGRVGGMARCALNAFVTWL